MSKLDEIINKYHDDVDTADFADELPLDYYPRQKAKQAIKDLMLEIIGEDEPGPVTTQRVMDGRTFYDEFDHMLRPGRNDLRATLRQKVSEL